MIIAEQKRKENIAEYLLYMYQVEDMIRANKLDLDSIESSLISKFQVSYEVKRDMREWYKTLITMMKEEEKEKFEVYEIVSGDTLGGIAKRYYGNASQYTRIHEANKELISDPNKIYPGQKIRIPLD